jgi:CRP-like cAMP-binding protein
MTPVDWPLLAPLPPERRAALLAGARRRRYPKGQAVFHEGDAGNALFLLERGHVAVRLTTFDGHEITVLVLGPGASFGELALFDERRERNASVIALDTVEALRIDRDTFVELVGVDDGLRVHLVGQLVSSVQRSTTLYAEALHLSSDKRVKRRLVELAELYGAESSPPTVRLTHDDLATVAGTSRQTVTETLGELAAAGVVTQGRGFVRIDDLDRLRTLSS